MSNILNETALRALKRAELQRLAKREGLRAVGAKDALIASLLEKCPGGVEPLEKEQAPVRRSKRRDAAKSKVEGTNEAPVLEGNEATNVDLEGNGAANVGGPVYGDSISQFVPTARAQRRNKRLVQADEGDRREATATPPPQVEPLEQDMPAPRRSSRVSAVNATPGGAYALDVPPMSRTAAGFFDMSSRPVEPPVTAQRRRQEHITAGAPAHVAAQAPENSRAREGFTPPTQDFRDILVAQNIQLVPQVPGALYPSEPLATAQGGETEMPRPAAQHHTEQPSIISRPRPKRITAHTASPPSPRRPVFSRPVPPPAQLETGLSGLPAQAGPSRLLPTLPWLQRQGTEMFDSLSFAINRPSPLQRPRAPAPYIEQALVSPQSMHTLRRKLGLRETPPLSTRREPTPEPQSQAQAGPSTGPTVVHRRVREPEADLWSLVPPAQPQAGPSTLRRPRPRAGPTTVQQPQQQAGLQVDPSYEESSRLDPLYDLIPSSPESRHDEEPEAHGYLATLLKFCEGCSSDSDSEPEVDVEDERLAQLEQEAKEREEADGSDHDTDIDGTRPSTPKPVVGATQEQVEGIVRKALRVARAFEEVATKRREMERDHKFLAAQAEGLEDLRKQMFAKRLTIEYAMRASMEAGGWDSWKPDEDRWQEINLEAASDKMRRRLRDPEADVPFEFSDIVEEDENRAHFLDDEREHEPAFQQSVLGPAFELRSPSMVEQQFGYSSPPLPPSPLLVPIHAFPEPKTPPRHPRPAPTRHLPDSDSFGAASSSSSSSNADHSNAFHPSRILDEAAVRKHAEFSWRHEGISTSLTGTFANVTPAEVVPATRPVESSASYLVRKRQRDDEDDEVYDPSWSSAEEYSNADSEGYGAPQAATAQTSYRPRPVPRHPASETMPDAERNYPYAYIRPAEWRDIRGGRISPSPPKRARHDRS